MCEFISHAFVDHADVLYSLSSKGDGHAYWDLIAPEGLTGELMLLRGQIYHVSRSNTSA